MAAYQEVCVCGFEEFNQAVEQHEGKRIFALFVGSKDTEGNSWCPLCTKAEPVIREGLKSASQECVFIYCQVGDKPYWRDPNNDFRKKLNVTSVPTLLKYGHLKNWWTRSVARPTSWRCSSVKISIP